MCKVYIKIGDGQAEIFSEIGPLDMEWPTCTVAGSALPWHRHMYSGRFTFTSTQTHVQWQVLLHLYTDTCTVAGLSLPVHRHIYSGRFCFTSTQIHIQWQDLLYLYTDMCTVAGSPSPQQRHMYSCRITTSDFLAVPQIFITIIIILESAVQSRESENTLSVQRPQPHTTNPIEGRKR